MVFSPAARTAEIRVAVAHYTAENSREAMWFGRGSVPPKGSTSALSTAL
ncbi:hypothetical protein BN381_140050 [Candidatus Microthrix parvicella RN1]|uniref:Uncharacterized protein n=1 Tax=Candidatus Neomicrothrix parvicella RN1 TaxID=1229780 RepID=R4YXI4_9ACTN|nr:hypothetical protein BN381_140050 [Candidatus Microthrix parvicella RN1]